MNTDMVDRIVAGAKHTHKALLLYGSYSRGDQDESSDIDVLEITDRPQLPYSIKNINYSPYSLPQLTKMAGEGNLFVLHLIMEGKVIQGDQEILSTVKTSFVYPDNYDFFRAEIIETAGLLDITETTFSKNKSGYYGLLCYLFRSYLYSLAVDDDDICFSVKYLSQKYKDPDILKVFSFKNKKLISYTDYKWCRETLEKLTEETFRNSTVDSVELLKILKTTSPFGFKVAMHFLENYASEVYV